MFVQESKKDPMQESIALAKSNQFEERISSTVENNSHG